MAQRNWDPLVKTDVEKLDPTWVSHTQLSMVNMAYPCKNAVLAVQRVVPRFWVLRGCLFLAGRTKKPCRKDPALHFSHNTITVGFIIFQVALLQGCWNLPFGTAWAWHPAPLLLLWEGCSWKFLCKVTLKSPAHVMKSLLIFHFKTFCTIGNWAARGHSLAHSSPIAHRVMGRRIGRRR